MQRSDLWVWLDLEMTGLDPEHDRIIEIACIITDTNLEQVGDDFSVIVNQPDDILDGMDAWNTKQHGGSGLTDAVRLSQVSLVEAEHRFLEFLKQHLQYKTAPLCGNSICQDRRFIYAYMSKVANYLHYRSIDITSFKLVSESCKPGMVPYKRSNVSHRALDDIKGSIAEFQHYKEHWLGLDAGK